jgi:hypothetical protein
MMNSKRTASLAGCMILGLASVANAQLVVYVGCVVEDVPSFVSAISNFYEAVEGGVRPTIGLDQEIWNGESPATHTVILEYPDYETLEAFRNRTFGTMPGLTLFSSISSVATCPTEGLAIEQGVWGDRDAGGEYTAVFPLVTTDQNRYAEIFGDLAESLIEDAPGAIYLYANRAGVQTATNFVVYVAPTSLSSTSSSTASARATAGTIFSKKPIPFERSEPAANRDAS